MQAKISGPAETPGIVRAAMWLNLVLLLVALIGPRLLAGDNAGTAEAATAAMLFVIPMALILAVGAAAAIRAYILARRENRPLRWTAFLPLAVFLLGIAGTLLLVYMQ